ncbi:MAG: imelysin family protein [Planctomycetota bacterium]
MLALRFAPCSLFLAMLPAALTAQGEPPTDALRARVVADYARFAHDVYEQAEAGAVAMRASVTAFLAEPSEMTLAAARQAWTEARRTYGVTEVLRFYDGPIDHPRHGVETYLNAWPVDEAYIDYVVGSPDAGIVNDVERYPQLSAALLTIANERGGEASICLGWHAIEFLLWGQDLSADGPGARLPRDYQLGAAPRAERRRVFLGLATDLLVEHLAKVRNAWAPEQDNYRAEFVADPARAVARMLTGMTVLSGFELSGERLAVAYETQDQEQEHSCFSDTTHQDLAANQRGIAAVYFGGGAGAERAGLQQLAARVDASAAADVAACIRRSAECLRQIPAPIDQAMLGPDDAPGRRAILAAIQALEDQAEALAALALSMDVRVPLTPGGR